MGFSNALNACFSLHELNHAYWSRIHDDGYPTARPGEDVPDWRTAAAGTDGKPAAGANQPQATRP
jgi:hypothetical protein